MSNKIKNIIGISAEIEKDDVAAPSSFHVIGNLNIDCKYKIVTATIESHFSRKYYETGKTCLHSQVITLHGLPPRNQDVFDWAYHSIVAPIAEGAADNHGNLFVPHLFTGAELLSE